jgi:spermidine dehydrogenase
VKVPLVYTNVQIRNRAAFEKLKIHGASCPGSFFSSVELDFPVSMGGYRYSEKAGDPCVVHLQHVPCSPGLPAREQQRAGRMKLYATTFEMFERNIRDQLDRMLSPGGFESARDIQAITVNRWPHGYAYEYNSLYDPDAGAFAYTNEAIDQAWRAVRELAAK